MPKTISSFTDTAIDSPNIRPVRVAHIETSVVSFYLCDRSFGSGSSKNKIGENVYHPLILSWSDVVQGYVDILNKNTPQSSETSFEVENTIPIYGYPNFFSVVCNDYVNTTVNLYEFFEGATSVDDFISLFKGKIENPELSGSRVVVHCVGVENSILNKFNPEVCDLSNYPTCDPDDIGKIFPIAFGRPKKLPFLAIDAGTLDNLSEAITEASVVITVSDILGFEVAGGILQIDQEQILYAGISGNSFIGCSRGYASTEAVAHNQGAVVAEIQTEYIYAIAHPIKAFDGVYVQHRKTGEQVLQSSSLYTLYTGQPGNEHPNYPGRAVIVFNALPAITEQINLSIEDTIDVDDNIGVPDPGHDHAGEPSYTTWNFDNAVATGYVYGDTDPLQGSNIAKACDGNLSTAAGIQGQGNTVTFQKVALQNLEGIPSQYRVCMALAFMDSNCGVTTTFLGHSVSGTVANQVYRTSWFALSAGQKDWDYIQGLTATATRTGTNPGGYAFIAEVWIEFITEQAGGTVSTDTTNVVKTGTVVKIGTVDLVGNSTADTVIGGRVSADIQGWMADDSGFYGVSGSVIEQPDYVMKKFLVYYCGFPIGGFGSSYTQANSDFNTYGSRVSPVLIERANAVDFLGQIAFESRAIQFFEEGFHQVYFLPNFTTSVKTFPDSRIIVDSLKLRLGARSEIVNSLSASYGKFWVETYEKKDEETTKGSIKGIYQVSIDDFGELTQDPLELQFINGEMQALSFLGWYIGERCYSSLEVDFDCSAYGADVRKGEVINIEFAADTLFYKLVSGLFQSIVTKFRVVNILVHENSTMTVTVRRCNQPVDISRTAEGVFSVAANNDDGVREYVSDALNLSANYNYVIAGLKESFLKFSNVTIPPESRIIKAYLTGITETIAGNVTNYGRIVVHFVNSAVPSAPTTYAEFDALSLTSGVEISSFFGASAFSSGKSQDFSSELQKIIDLPAWVSGNNVVVVLKNGSVAGYPVNLDLVSKDGSITLGSPPYNLGLSMSKDGQVIFLGRFHDAPRLSLDGGVSWRSVKMPIVFPNVLGYSYIYSDCDADGSCIIGEFGSPSTGVGLISFDFGNLWQNKLMPIDKSVYFQRSNQDGTILYAIENKYPSGGPSNWDFRLVKSINNGAWQEITSALPGGGFYSCIACNSSGSFIIALWSVGSETYRSKVSTNYGASFSDNSLGIYALSQFGNNKIACSSTGQYILTSNSGSTIYVSSNYGASFSSVLTGSGGCTGRAMNSTGQYMIVCFSGNFLYVSSNYGVTWTEVSPNESSGRTWVGVACNSTGSIMMATYYYADGQPSNKVFRSEDYGVTWAELIDSGQTISLEPRLVVDYVSNWADLTDSRYWQPADAGVTWDAVNSQWNFNVLAGSDGGQINVKGDWYVGFRPSKLRIIHDRSATNFDVYIYAQDGLLASVLDYSSNTDIDLNFAGRGDIAYIDIVLSAGENDVFHITAIEFYMGAAYSSTLTSTSTTSTTTSTRTTETGFTYATSTCTSSSTSTTTSTSTSTSSSTSSSTSTFSSSSTMSTYTEAPPTTSCSTTSTTNTQSSTTSTTRSTLSTTTTNTQSSTTTTTATQSSSSSTTSSSSSTASTISTISSTSSTASTISTISTSTSTSTSTSSSSTTTSTTVEAPSEFENFTTFTESDTAGDITINNSTLITGDTIRRDAVSCVYKDYGVGVFNDFDIEMKITITGKSGTSGPSCAVLALSNTIGTVQDMIDANNGLCVFIAFTSPYWKLFIYDLDSLVSDDYSSGSGSEPQTYYLTLSRGGTTLTLKIYSNAERTTLLDTLTATVANTAYRYLHAMTAREGSDFVTDTISLTVENLKIVKYSTTSTTSSSTTTSTTA